MSTRSSQRSASTSGRTESSSRSITSTVALEQLRQLDEILMRERQAREEAERTLSILQHERAEKDVATRRSEKTERQLQTILNTLSRVLENPDDLRKLRQLQRVAMDGATSCGDTASIRSSLRSSVQAAATAATAGAGTAGGDSVRSGGSSSSSYTTGSTSSSNSQRSSSSSQRKDEKKQQMLSSGAAAMLAAGGGGARPSSTSAKKNPYKETFFDKFGSGDERQKKAIERSYQTNGGLKAAGKSTKDGSPNNIPTNLPNINALKTQKALMTSNVAFTHSKSDLRPTF